ncbi:hypothetical protein JHN63_15205 [Streptomyces sp. MBT65]|uniref:hypothetical protein n=1 Tax=Streptomyces sp. MBT65 TaxID=1488395 RepID=UPI00190A13CE|nr:hypothetical protein [Streptomyces sp. MBT65]MBK3575136.1 hypothetical protein [Streptomyces sp. MBT65]
MYLIYQPEGEKEPQRFLYKPQKLMAPEREALERRSKMDFADFTKAVLNGNALARRSLLWVMLKRQHHTLKFEDVDFAWDELKLEYSKQEYELMRAQMLAKGNVDPEQLVQLDEEIATAVDEQATEGKALPPIAV